MVFTWKVSSWLRRKRHATSTAVLGYKRNISTSQFQHPPTIAVHSFWCTSKIHFHVLKKNKRKQWVAMACYLNSRYRKKKRNVRMCRIHIQSISPYKTRTGNWASHSRTKMCARGRICGSFSRNRPCPNWML